MVWISRIIQYFQNRLFILQSVNRYYHDNNIDCTKIQKRIDETKEKISDCIEAITKNSLS